MGRKSKSAKKIRQAGEFDVIRLLSLLRPPLKSQAAHAWTLEEIRNARDDQQRGVFRQPVRLAESMRTDDALFTAYANRLAPQRCIGVRLEPAGSAARAKSVAREGDGLFGPQGVGITPATLATINGTLANHGVAVGINRPEVSEDGSRVNFRHEVWPLEWVRWDPILRCLVTQVEQSEAAELEAEVYETRGGLYQIPIIHGDGRWVIYSKHDFEPWKHEACVMPGALVWARHAFAGRDWAKGSQAHGNAKVVGEMPEGMALQDDATGALTVQAQAFLELLQAIASVDSPAGIRPAGSKTDFIEPTSTNWQVFSELMGNADKAAARIYLGTDGTLGAQGGAPGVDISALFGVATTIIQGDLEAIERAVLTGIIEPWCAINFGDSSLAPRRRYLMPDVDSEQHRANLAKRLTAFHDAIAKLRSNGFQVNAETVAELAEHFAVPVPQLTEESNKAPSIALAPTDLARVVSVNEARASAGLGPLLLPDGAQDPDGRLTVEEFAAKKAAKSEAAVQPAPAQNVRAVS